MELRFEVKFGENKNKNFSIEKQDFFWFLIE